MKKQNKITDAEWEVMEVLWEKSSVSSREIIKNLKGKGWKPTTIRTLLSRLVKKDFVAYDEGEYAYKYYPLVNRETLVKCKTEYILEKIYKGNISSMIAGFINDEKLSKKDKAKLRELLDNNDNQGGGE